MASVRTQPFRIPVDLAAALAEARANTAAVIEVIGAVGRDTTNATVVQSALHAVKTAFGYDYGACWMIDREAQHTTFAAETHSLGSAFDRINRDTHYMKGQGLTGKTWAAADTVFTPELASIPNSDLVRAACAAGAVSAVAFPFIVEDQVHGVLFFFSFRSIAPSEDRLGVLRNIGRLVGQAFSRLLDLERETREQAALRRNAELVLAAVEAAQRGDLTLDIPVAGDNAVAQVARGLGEFFANLRLSIRSLMQNANGLTKASGDLSRLSVQMMAHSGETSQSAASAALASKEVSANIEGIAAGSAEMRASMSEIEKSASIAASDIHSAVCTADATRSVIAKLAASSKDIGAMVKVIESIARQTRLLALNASIEAARAGAAGPGFTVVANEVKELAKETSKATEQIGEKIAAMQADTANAVKSITDIGNVFEKVSQTSSKIAETVEEQSSTTREIGENVTQAAAGSSSISDKISSVAGIAQQAQQQASQTQSAAKELASMALELHGLVSRFKVD